ncbi:hypothetical protein [Streptomyces sp. NPDC058664]
MSATLVQVPSTAPPAEPSLRVVPTHRAGHHRVVRHHVERHHARGTAGAR